MFVVETQTDEAVAQNAIDATGINNFMLNKIFYHRKKFFLIQLHRKK